MTNRIEPALATCFAMLIAGCAGPSRAPISGLNRAQSTLPSADQAPSITLIYPKLEIGDTMAVDAVTDSAFFFGNVTGPHGQLTVQGYPVEIDPFGAWLAWIPMEDGRPAVDDSLGEGEVIDVLLEYEAPGGLDEPPFRFSQRFWLFEAEVDEQEMAVWEPRREIVVVTDTLAKIRCGWPGTYYLFPPPGTVLDAVGIQGVDRRFWRVPLGNSEVGYIEETMVEVQPEGALPPKVSSIENVICMVEERRTVIRIPLREKVPYRVHRVADDRLELTIYGAVSWTDLIIQPVGSRVVDELRWQQVDPVTYRLTAYIRTEWFWGWDSGFGEFELKEDKLEGDLIWTIFEAPGIGRKPLKGLRVLLDPGHGGGEEGSRGPLGLFEKDANLAQAAAVRDQLTRAGAQVVVTRDSDTELPLAERGWLVRTSGADIVISIHFNGLTQGLNPAFHHGPSVHYYHRHAKPLADTIYGELISSVSTGGGGVRYQDLYLPRFSFCPAVLVEHGYLLHRQEEMLARDPGFRGRLAVGLRRGLQRYLLDMRRAQKKSGL